MTRRCDRHTEHALRGGDGLVGRHFPDSNRWPEGLWEPCDSELGDMVYCTSHLHPHATGWCSVSNRDKIPLRATTLQEAIAECRAAGLRLHTDERSEP